MKRGHIGKCDLFFVFTVLPRCQYRFCKEHFLRGLLFLLDTAVAEVELLVRFLLREEKVDAEGLGAELVLRVEDLNLYIHDVAPLAHDRGLKRDVILGGVYGLEIPYLHA